MAFSFHCSDNHIPCMEVLPKYIMNLAQKVNWDGEQLCFQTFCHQTALFYAFQPDPDDFNERKGLV